MGIRWQKPKNEFEGPSSVLQNLLQTLKVPFDAGQVREDLLAHPTYPAISSMVGTLNAYGVESDAYGVEPGAFHGLTTPFIGVMNDDKFCLVLETTEASVTVVDDKGEQETRDGDTFAEQWKGFFILAEARDDASAQYEDPSLGFFERAWLPAAIVAGAGVIFSLLGAWSMLPLMWFGLAAVGFGTSVLLVGKSMGSDTAFALTQKVCTAGKYADCQSVLDSPAAKIGPLSMSDIGLVYFGGVALTTLIGLNHGPTLSALVILAWLAVPYTLFSVSYQAFVVRQYCALCLVVQGVLLGHALLGLGHDFARVGAPNLQALAYLATGLGVAIAGWALAKPAVRDHIRTPLLMRSHKQITMDPELLSTRLFQADQAESLPTLPMQVIEGSENPALVISYYGSPSCGFCAEGVPKLRKLAKQFNETLQVRIWMGEGGRDLAPDDARTMRAVCEKHAQGDMAGAADRLERWAKAFPKSPGIGEVQLSAEAQALFEAYNEASPGFEAYPTVFVGNRALPTGMRLEHLQALLLNEGATQRLAAQIQPPV